MPHKIAGDTAEKSAMTARPPFGPGFETTIARQAARMETWGSSFSDPGDDWCEWRLFDEQNKQIATKRVAGY